MTETKKRSLLVTRATRWQAVQRMRLKTGPDVWLKEIIRTVAAAIQLGGGAFQTGKRVYKVFRRDGLAGIRRSLHVARSAARSAARAKPPARLGNDYREWIFSYETETKDTRKRMLNILDKLQCRPMISIIMPVYNPRPEWLTAAIESVLAQTYPDWELCIADDASTDPSIRRILRGYENADNRIRIVFREENGHISAASNSALEIATGQWIALLDQDDLFSEHALLWMADAINAHPTAGLLYSDEDKIDEDLVRSDPYFKPDWNYDLFLSQNYICHLGVYSRELLTGIDGFRQGVEGAQDWDLALRCIEQLAPNQIVHIPWVLYHWRSHPESTAQSGSAKSYAHEAGRRVLQQHLERCGVAGTVVTESTGYYRVRYELPKSLPLVSLIIPTRDGLELLTQCVSSIMDKTDYPHYEILIVDNGSNEQAVLDYLADLAKNPRIRVLRDDRPFNFSALNNSAVREARGEIIGLINNDIEVISRGWLREMVSLALQPGVGAVGARLWYPDDTLQHGGVVLGIGGVAGHSHKYLPRGSAGYFGRAALIQSFSAVTAACLVVQREIYEQVGGLDEDNLAVAFNDVDFCLKVREAGYRNVWTPYAELYHHESATRGHEDTPEKQQRFAQEVAHKLRRWGRLLTSDPAYSPNLTLECEDFSYSWPPRSKVGTYAVSEASAEKLSDCSALPGSG